MKQVIFKILLFYICYLQENRVCENEPNVNILLLIDKFDSNNIIN